MPDDGQDREQAFVHAFDARFPYDDEGAASRLIAEGRASSLNANFCVLEQICCPPRGTPVGKLRLLDLLQIWSIGFEHELKEPIVRCARAVIQDEPLSYEECAATVELVARHDGQRAALNLAYYSVGAGDELADANLLRRIDEIVSAWEGRSV